MPVSNTNTFTAATANGVTTVFPYNFTLLSEDDLVVTVAGVVTTTGFTVSGVGDAAGGNVTFTVAPANLARVLLERVVTLTRSTDYQYVGSLASSTLDADFDRLWLATQQVSTTQGFAPSLPIDSYPGVSLALPSPATNGFWKWNAAGTAIEYVALSITEASALALAENLVTDADPLKGAALIGYKGRTQAEKNADFVSVKDHGGTGSGTETTAFTDACTAAAASTGIVYIPFATFTVANGTDCQGCAIIGKDTAFTGRLINHGGLHSIKLYGHNQSDCTISPATVSDDAPKLHWRSSSTLDYVFVAKKTRGYLMFEMGKNATTTSASLAATTSEATRRRMTKVQDAVWVNTYKHTPSTTSGTFSEISVSSLIATVVPANNGGRALKYWRTTTVGDYLEFQTYPRKGLLTIGLFCGVSGEPACAVTINGAAAGNVSCLAAVSSAVKVITIPAQGYSDQDLVTIRLTKSTADGTGMSIFGVNFVELKDWDGHDYDEFAYLRHTTNYAEYLTQGSANDCVIREYESGLYGVSFHGGETGIVSDWYKDGAIYSPSTGAFAATRNLELRGAADVSWAIGGGGSLHIDNYWKFGLGGISHEASLSGDVVVTELYTHMFGTNEAFSKITMPGQIDLTAAADGSRSTMGRTNTVIMVNPTTGQRIISRMSMYDKDQNQYGGPHIWKVVGSYHKLYYGPCLGGKMRITSLGLVSSYEFE